MEHDSSFIKQMRKNVTARGVMNKEIRMLESDMDKNIGKIDEITREINRTQNTIR